MKVLQSKDNIGIKVFNSVSEASKILNIKRDLILRCCKGKQQTAKGYQFKYNYEVSD